MSQAVSISQLWRNRGGDCRWFVGLDKSFSDNKVASGMKTGNQVKFGVSKAQSLSAWSMRSKSKLECSGQDGRTWVATCTVAENKVGIFLRQSYLLGVRVLGRGTETLAGLARLTFFFKRLLTD
jgi:hypothetical protein